MLCAANILGYQPTIRRCQVFTAGIVRFTIAQFVCATSLFYLGAARFD
jgi:hypothetical protein